MCFCVGVCVIVCAFVNICICEFVCVCVCVRERERERARERARERERDRKLQAVLCYLQLQKNKKKTNKYIASYLPETTESEAVNSHLKEQSAAKRKVLKGNNEKQEQLQSAIDGLSKTVESLNRKVQFVYTCKVNVVTTLKWTKILPAINRVTFQPNTEVSKTFSASTIWVLVGNIYKLLMSITFHTHFISPQHRTVNMVLFDCHVCLIPVQRL